MDAQHVSELVDELSSGRLSRREFVTRALAAGLSLSALGGMLATSARGGLATAAADKSLSVLDWGGPYADALNKYAGDPFSARTGAKLKFTEQARASDSLAKIQAQKKNPSVDIWLTTGALPLLLAKSGGLAELNPKTIPNLPNILPVALQK